jgi:hypothetical protein
MSAITLKAHFDGKQICLDEPYPLEPDTKLMVTVVSESDEAFEEEREAWFELGRHSLARAYGTDEPDYSDCIGKMPPSE